MNNIFYKTIQDLEKQKKLYADCKVVHNCRIITSRLNTRS